MAGRAPNPVLRALFETGVVTDADGHEYPLHSDIGEAHAAALYRTVLRERPALVVEVGMAYGVSSLAILAALAHTTGRLISIDPFQCTDWHGIGLENVRRAGYADLHTLLEQPDYLALPQLVEQGLRIDLAYIDGWHTFDYTMLDLFYVDRLLRPGGVIGVNDCGMWAVHKALRYLCTHRDYRPIDVGLRACYRGHNLPATLLRAVTGRSITDRYLRKQRNWEPDWNYWKLF